MKGNPSPPPEWAEQRRRRRERYIMAAVALGLVGSTALSVYLSGPSTLVSLASNILVFGLLFLNIILVLLLLFLVVRNVVKLLFERKRGIFGAKLRTKFVAAFVGFSVIPAVGLFVVAISYIGKSTDLWLNNQIQQSLGMSRELTEIIRNTKAREAISLARNVARWLASKEDLLEEGSDLRAHLEERRRDLQIDMITVYSPRGEALGVAVSKALVGDSSLLRDKGKIPLRKILRGEEWWGERPCDMGQLVEGVVPLYRGYDPKDIRGAVVASLLIPRELEEPMQIISQTHEQYKELTSRKGLIELNYYVILTVVLLVIVFLSTWFGFYLAKQITVPLQEVAEKTKEVAKGRLDFRLEGDSRDEIGALVESFNQMAEELKKSYSALEISKKELEQASAESEKRRKYMEAILGNIGSGVISLDREERVVMANSAARRILKKDPKEAVGRPIDEVLPEETLGVVRSLMEELRRTRSGAVQLETHLHVEGGLIPFRVLVSGLREEGAGTLGTVVVMDDLTDVVKAQKVLAWKEVARRVAHEIKNPLTPIKLSAERIRKRHPELLEAQGGVLDECTRTIIEQVDHLQEMVNEFQRFARMPEPQKNPQNINQIVREVVALYKESHPQVEMEMDLASDLPKVPADKEQMQRVLINLITNAIAILPPDGGKIQLRTAFNKALRVVRLEVADNGPGIPPSSKSKLFEPYFSTKEGGMGLGLTIVRSIVSDHGGYIRVVDNEPKGTRFVVELPL
jgi:two-component system nitrogen regulation sensor histidine kinase NtrY